MLFCTGLQLTFLLQFQPSRKSHTKILSEVQPLLFPKMFTIRVFVSSTIYYAVLQLQSTGWFKKIDSLCKSFWPEQWTALQHTPDSWLRYSKFSARSTGWLAWATFKTLLNSSHVLTWYTWSAGAFAFTQTASLLKLVIPTTNALPSWSLNVETKTKCTLYSSRRLSFN